MGKQSIVELVRFEAVSRAPHICHYRKYLLNKYGLDANTLRHTMHDVLKKNEGIWVVPGLVERIILQIASAGVKNVDIWKNSQLLAENWSLTFTIKKMGKDSGLLKGYSASHSLIYAKKNFVWLLRVAHVFYDQSTNKHGYQCPKIHGAHGSIYYATTRRHWCPSSSLSH